MPDSNELNGNQLSLSRFAFNIYGALNQTQSLESNVSPSPTPSMVTKLHNKVRPSNTNKLIYNCEREVISISQLNRSLDGLVKNYEENPLHHLIIGGKNYLKLFAMSSDQTSIIHEVDILELSKSVYSSSKSNKLTSVNTIESQNDTIACELATGLISIYKVQNNGKCKLIRKYSDHKRCVNSLDFINESSNMNASLPFQLLSGSQDGTVKLWDLRSASSKPTITISSNAHSDPVRSCQYSPHSTSRNKITVLSVHDSGALCKYDLRSPNGGYHQNINMPERKWNSHTGPALSLNIHPEKEYVITGGRDQKICIWNYGDSHNSQNKMSPDYMINTYGPVMKIRWSAYATSKSKLPDNLSNSHQQQLESRKYDDKTTSNERETNSMMASPTHSNPLYNYDFACMFLNEDPTITIYNLKRKFIPKEVISSNSNKPFQNFVWAKNMSNSRRIWTITKGNQFVSYDLEGVYSDSDIMKPLDNLANVSMSWSNGLADLCFVNQDKSEFESTSQFDNDSLRSESEEYEMESGLALDGSGLVTNSYMEDNPTDDRSLKYRVSSNSLDNSSIYNHHSKNTVTSIPIASNPSSTPLSYQNPSLPSSFSPPFDQMTKPLLQRASTHNPMAQAPKGISSKIQSRNAMGIEALMDYGNNFASSNASSGYLRPALNRNPSQSTQGSNTLPNSSIFPHQTPPPLLKRTLSVNYPSPYLIPLSLPLPQNNEEIFDTLSGNYMISLRDGFNLIDVCLFNANVSAAVNRCRECQTWRVLAVSLQEDESNVLNYDEKYTESPERLESSIPSDSFENVSKNSNSLTKVNQNDNRSILSELDNFVGSYNSNSTLTSNYGGFHSDKDISHTIDSQIDCGINQKEPNRSFKNVDNEEMCTRAENKLPNDSSLKDDNNSDSEPQIFEGDSNINEKDERNFNESLQKSYSPYSGDAQNSPENESILKKYPSMPVINLEKTKKNSSYGNNISDDNENSRSSSKIGLLDIYARIPMREDRNNMQINRHGFVNYQRRKSFGPEIIRRNSKNSYNHKYSSSWDLDNENLNSMNNRMQNATNNSLSSYGISPYQPRIGSPNYVDQSYHSYNRNNLSPRPYYRSTTPGSSRKNSHISPVHGFHNKTSYLKQSSVIKNLTRDEMADSDSMNVKEQIKEEDYVDDVSKNSISFGKSNLTKAITDDNNNLNNVLFKPWKTENLLKEILDFSSQQGDVLLCSTLTILFYDYLKTRNSSKCISKEQSLIWLSLYVEILRRKQLFSNAMYIVNMAPKDLLPDLSSLSGGEVNLRFYCCWCQKLLVNERSKRKVQNDNFGYWYCDECSTKQLNCIYCNEPCKGLNIVTSLSCGHRGHFGCLREWFVEQENIECPGGCDEVVI